MPDPPSFTPKGYGNVAEVAPDFDILDDVRLIRSEMYEIFHSI